MIIKTLKLTNITKLILFTALLLTVVIPLISSQRASAVSASDWKPGRIIDDTVFYNKDSMSASQIQQFLDAKVPICDRNRASSNPSYQPPWTCLKEYQENINTREHNIGKFNSNGTPYQVPGGKSAAQIIWDIGQQYGINPQVLIVMLQKEQALITDTWPYSSQYQKAMGYACPDTAPCDTKYYGFYNQVSSAAWQLKRYIAYPNSYNFKAGVNRYIQHNPNASCGGSQVFIENPATAALYNYTPYQPNQSALNNLYGSGDGCGAYGNRNFWRYFNDWFGSTFATNVAYDWQYVWQEAYMDSARTQLLTGETTIEPGNKLYLRVKVKNIGYRMWQKNILNLGTSKSNDRTSIFYTQNWLNQQRPTTVNTDVVNPGEVAIFDFEVTAPAKSGTYREYFNLVADGIGWLKDLGLHYSINVVDPVMPPATVTRMGPGQILSSGNYMISEDKKSVLQMQKDGNLVLYFNFTQPAWYSRTSGTGTNNKLVMQSDGNLVLYSASNVPLWNTETAGNPGAILVMQSDGNLVLYSASNVPLWSAYSIHTPHFYSYVNTTLPMGTLIKGQSLDTADRKYRLIFQYDGNVVLYKATTPIWATGTDGKDAEFLTLQPDGNLVLYDNKKFALWNSKTYNTGPNHRLTLQPDGNLVLYDKYMIPVWNTQTSQ